MKQLIVIIVLSVSVVLATGSCFFYKAHLSCYKNDYRTYISSNFKDITKKVITINKNDLYKNSANLIWEDDNQELVFNKQLYDVIGIKLVNNNIEITVVSDEKEQDIKEQFASLYHNDLNKEKNSPIKMLKQFLALKCVVISHQQIVKFDFLQINKENTPYSFKATKGYLSQEIQPPIFS